MDIASSNWSETDASNDTAAPDGFPEGMAPSGVNNAARMMMGAIKRWWDQYIPKSTDGTGTSSAYTLTYSVAPTALADGMVFLVRFDKVNALSGGATTLNINNLGAKPIYKWQGAAWVSVIAGDLQASQIERVTYDQTSGTFRLLDWVGTAAQYNVGNQANNVVQLDGNAKLPAVDGSQLTGVQQFTTGDVKETYKTTADTGWVMLDDGSVGDASSGGTTRANADCEALFTVLWGISSLSIQDSSGSSSTKGATAAADWAAHKRMLLPLRKGRSPIGSGTGSGLTARSLGATGGAETASGSATTGTAVGGTHEDGGGANTTSDPNHVHGVTITVATMHPWSGVNYMMKL
jgi:hypothetical protein